jgi:hypothetical protein
MKTITLLWMGAALVLAADQDQDKKTAKQPTTAPAKVAHERPSEAAPAPAPVRPNLHKSTVTPVAPKLTPQQKAAAALPSVPEGAKEVGPNLYRYTDAQGKNWLLRKTPFGVSKWEEKPGEQLAAESPSPVAATAKDLGDSVEFQRMTPFGPQKWVRKKSELSDEEKATLAASEQARQAALGAKPADTVKPPEKP